MANVTHECILIGGGDDVAYTPSADIAAGEVDILNGMFRFATQPILDTILGSVKAAGGHPTVRIVKVTGSMSVGNQVYWDDNGNVVGATTSGTGAVTTSSGASDAYVGRVIAAAGGTDQTVDVQLSLPVATKVALANAIGDPGHDTAIPVDASGYVSITTAAAETNTLAAPTFVGQELLLYCAVYDVGDRVITCATLLNDNGADTITFQAIGETVLLVAIEEVIGTYRWRVVFQDPTATVS